MPAEQRSEANRVVPRLICSADSVCCVPLAWLPLFLCPSLPICWAVYGCRGVCQFDYLARDSHQLGIPTALRHERLVKNCRVIDNEICFNSKEIFNIYESEQHQPTYQPTN